LATDLGIGVPLENGLHSTLISMRQGYVLHLGRHAEVRRDGYWEGRELVKARRRTYPS
jgi:hypothetical protein